LESRGQEPRLTSKVAVRGAADVDYLDVGLCRQAALAGAYDDLVGCALSSGDPLWLPTPEPHWRIPYRSFDGTVLIVVDVDARTGAIALTNEERAALMDRIERLITAGNVTAFLSRR